MNTILKEDFDYILCDKNINWSELAGATILVSGASGFLPSYLIKSILYLNSLGIQKPVKILALVRNIEKAKAKYKDYLNDPNLVFLAQDVTKPVEISEKIDYIIHAASQASPKFFFSDPVGTINANTLGTSNLLALAKEKNVKSFLYFSSGEVCGDIFEHKNLVSEDDYGIVNPLDVRNCYSESKRMGENMCFCWNYQYGVPVKIVRPSHTYGPGFSFDDGRAFTSFVASVVKGEDIVLKSDGSAKRSFVYLADAVRAYIFVLLKGENGAAYNVGYDGEISILELANMLVSLSGNKNITVRREISASAPSSKVANGLLDISKLKSMGWYPNISEEKGFKRTMDYFIQELETQKEAR